MLNKSFKKIVLKKETISNLSNNQMNVIIGGETFPTMCWACTGACSAQCDRFTNYACPPMTEWSGTSICYDVCY